MHELNVAHTHPWNELTALPGKDVAFHGEVFFSRNVTNCQDMYVLKYPFFRDVNKGCSVVEWGRPQFSYEWAHIHCSGPWYNGSIKCVLQLCWKLPGEVKGGGGVGEAWLTYRPYASSIDIILFHHTYQILLNAMLIAFCSWVRAWLAAGGYHQEVCSWWPSRGKLH